MKSKFFKKITAINTLILVVFGYSGFFAQKVQAADDSLESSYSLADVIPENTEAKFQCDTPWCLSFSTMATMESALGMQDKKAGKQATKYDFSEEHMAYSTQDSSFNDSKINKMGLHRNVDTGAPAIARYEYLTNGMGVVDESSFPFDNSTGNIDISKLNQPIAATALDTFSFPQLTITKSADFTTDKIADLIKEMKLFIKNYGGISAMVALGEKGDADNDGDYDDYECINGLLNTLNNPYNIAVSSLNHAVCIIGWDDNYSKDNFNSDVKPQNDGAWIVKNSYGDGKLRFGTFKNWQQKVYDGADEQAKTTLKLNSPADVTEAMVKKVVEELYDNYVTNATIEDGYVYAENKNKYMHISYETPSLYLQNLGIIKAETGKNYDNLYQYDEFGPTLSVNMSDTSKIYLANVFNRDKTKNEKLTRVGIYVPLKQSYQIYVNPNSSNKTMSDMKAVTVNGNNTTVTLDVGFHTLELDNPLDLTGSSFVVLAKAMNDSGTTKISIEYDDNSSGITDNIEAKAGQSFYSIDDKLAEINWNDFYNFTTSSGSKPGNLNIKAYTKEYSTENPSTNTTEPENIVTNTVANTTRPNNTVENTTRPENNTVTNPTNTTKPGNNTVTNTTNPTNTTKPGNNTVTNPTNTTKPGNNTVTNPTNTTRPENKTVTNTVEDPTTKPINGVKNTNGSSENPSSEGSTGSQIGDLQNELSKNKYVTTSPSLTDSGKDDTVSINNIPKTGDNSRTIIYAIVIIAAIGIVGFINYIKLKF